jgi:hypothetical protein
VNKRRNRGGEGLTCPSRIIEYRPTSMAIDRR